MPKIRKARATGAFEIMVLTKSASDTLYQYFGQHGDKVVQPLVQKLDKQQVLSQRTR